MAFGARQNAAALTPMEVSLFFREYFLLFESGIGLSDAAYIMAENSADDRAALCKGIAERIDEGTPLSQALAETGRFPHHALHMVEIGQTSGRLDSVLEGLALFYERQDRLENSIRSALTYPLIMIGVMAAVLGVLVIKVLPMFGAVFKDTGAKMPLILRLVTESSGFTALLIGIIIAVLVVLIAAFRGAGRALTSGEDAKGILASLPFMKQIIEKTASGNFAYTMALLLSGGVPIESALEQTMELTESQWVKSRCQEIKSQLETGETFASAVSKCGIFDGTFAALLTAGEKAGKTDSIMNLIADRYTEEVDNKIGSRLAIIEPTIVIIISIVIGIILLSIMMPLMNVLGA